MVDDLIGIFVLKGSYYTLTMTDWFFQALSVIPTGSWGDVARRFTMIRWVSPKNMVSESQMLCIDRSRAQIFKSSAAPRERDPDPPLRRQYDDQNSSQLNQKRKAGIGYVKPENKSSWLKNKLDKEKAKAGSNREEIKLVKISNLNSTDLIVLMHRLLWTICWGTTADPDHASRRGIGRTKFGSGDDQYNSINMQAMTIHRVFSLITLLATRAWLRPVSRGNRHFTVGGGRLRQSGITDTACKNQLVMVSVQYGPFNPYIPIRSTTIGKSRVAKDPIAMHTSWRSNSDIASVTSIGHPRMSASGESSTTMHRLLHASGSHPIPPTDDPKTNQYNQDLGLIHSTNGNHLESPNEGSSIDHQVTIYLHAQNITMFPTNETWYIASQILVSSSGGLILDSRHTHYHI
ncbi:hypothetical protein F511_19724 [Dorcoceras hygrometricum]|uniref:Uncharacterized protein n=1 Tax=Dorcoceras hygrometricum TaxID=472368 RepID=A0A2Z7CPE2_9LAMI|nr:hypothetical protein F511_19724 [Dorcoceras hygrometricum]